MAKGKRLKDDPNVQAAIGRAQELFVEYKWLCMTLHDLLGEEVEAERARVLLECEAERWSGVEVQRYRRLYASGYRTPLLDELVRRMEER